MAGRPPVTIDWDQVKSMAKIQCTGPEIASVLEIDRSTLEKRCKKDLGQNLSAYINENKQGGKASLRRVMWKSALGGNVTMMIWLSKNELGMKDQQVVDTNFRPSITICDTEGNPKKHIELGEPDDPDRDETGESGTTTGNSGDRE